MIYVLAYLNIGLAVFVLTWLLFILVMKVKDYPKPYVYIFLPFGLVGWILDILFNIFYATVIFWQLPDIHKGMKISDATLSHRLRQILRHDTKITDNMVRYKLACLICRYLIEPHDPTHCGRETK